MCRLKFTIIKFCIFSMIIINLIRSSYATIENDRNLTKCCDSNQLLTKELICANNTEEYLHYYVHHYYEYNNNNNNNNSDTIDDGIKFNVMKIKNSSFFNDCNNTELCIDYVKDINKTMLISCERDVSKELDKEYIFHKCCPLKYKYNSVKRSCVPTNNNNNNNSNTKTSDDLFISYERPLKNIKFIKYGLSQCRKPIVDYKGKTLDELQLQYDYKNLNSNKYCIDQNVEENDGTVGVNVDRFVLRICKDTFDVCNINNYKQKEDYVRCLRKCCPDGYMYEGSVNCRPTFNSGFNIFNKRILNSTNDKIGIIAGIYCRKYVAQEWHKFHIDEYGYLQIRQSNALRTYSYTDDASYCIENVNVQNITGQKIFLCAQKGNNIKFEIARYFIIISCILLLLTIIGYLTLPKLLNLFGKTLICYCSCLLFAYILTSVTQFGAKLNANLCTVLAFLIFYAYLMAFSWLNIMSIDIWLTFRSLRSQAINQKQSERKKFLLYNLYAWSIGTIWTLIALIIFRYSDGMPDHLMLRLAEHKCFFMIPREYNYGYVIFFVTPVTILIACNCYLFVKTILYYMMVKGEINNMKDDVGRRKKFLADKERLTIVLKLFVIMGVLWIFEILTSFYSLQKFPVWKHLEIAFDIINASQGIFIFCIFMLKKKVLEAFKVKFGLNRYNSSHSDHPTETSMINASVRNKGGTFN